MGVPLLLTWLKRRFAKCFFPATGDRSTCPAIGADCLYIDANGVVYQAAAAAVQSDDMDAAILRKVFDLLDDIVLRLVQPRSLVYIAVDGVSPLGKLAQQRSRRRRSGGSSGRRGECTQWDSNSISVGTPFMSRLTDALHFYAASRTERINSDRLRNNVALGPISFVVDDVTRPGEGENKITDAIRRFRSQPQYDPNTSHIICSSDTDVTVCGLILHEPRIHLLRYEYVPQRATNNGSWKNRSADSWASTFFSIHAFREQLRECLGLQSATRIASASGCGGDGGSGQENDDNNNNNSNKEESERRSQQFERALHDVVFVLLLFGNDFLPSLGCRIEEGFLDDLLQLLATDFISRDRFIVDPVTNTIQFDAARYALDCLAEMRSDRSLDGGALRIDNGADGSADWGFDDAASRERREAAEQQQYATRCYAYWTMLQWSLLYSAGVVEDWGCYYPFATAPPLHMLRKYCGVLSYDALIALAKEKAAGKGKHGVHSEGPEVVERGQRECGPTDVLAQLLILMPTRSVALLPFAVRNAYAEVEPLVQLPVESLDFAAIAAWCERKRRLFTEEERARFSAYALGADVRVFACGAAGECLRGDELVLVADWDPKDFAAEAQRSAEAQATTAQATATISSNTETIRTKTETASSMSFFNARSVRGASAAVSALLAVAKSAAVPKHSEGNGPSGDGNSVHHTVECVERHERDAGGVEAISGRGFTMWTAPTAVLADAAIAKVIGGVAGDAFVCGEYNCGPLSRDSQTMRVRLRWRVASKPLLRDASAFVPDLLPGYEAPPPPPPPCNRSKASDVSGSKRHATAHSSDDTDDTDDDETTKREMTELEKKKEAVRRRLEALQAAKSSAATTETSR